MSLFLEEQKIVLEWRLKAAELYVGLIQENPPQVLTENLCQVIMNLEKIWVTINGRHVNIGGDGSSGGGGFSPLPSDKAVTTLRAESEKWISGLNKEQLHSLKKYTKNTGETGDDKFYQRLNAMLRGDAPENESLRHHAQNISSALKKNKLQHDILCYRSTQHNPVEGLKVGDIYEPKQFLSSSVAKKGVLKKWKLSNDYQNTKRKLRSLYRKTEQISKTERIFV